MPRRVLKATLLAFSLHGLLILTARYRLSYDAYHHMFFADHYLQDWWSLWETRWYTGFTVTSYPPLLHQLIALIGRITGVDAGFALVLWGVLSAYPSAVYAFCRIFAGRDASSYAAYASALLPSLFLSAHVFGQLPTLAALLGALFAIAALVHFIRDGAPLTAAVAVSLFAAMMAAHHATLLAIPWLAGAAILQILYKKKASRRTVFTRLAVVGVLAAAASWLVIFPFWQWGAQQSLQTPIDHLSRSNFFQESLAFVLFFLPVYGLLIPLIPLLPWIGRGKLSRGVAAAFAGLFILGLGGTTPLPRLLFGEAWTWLTFDRFALWASLLLLPYFGVFAVDFRRKLATWVHAPRKPHTGHLIMTLHRGFLAVAIFIALLIGLIPTWMPTQPTQLNMQPIVDFLAQAEHQGWRYLTFGLGDQLAYLSRLTPATTMDGSYHTARTLPELRSSGVGQIDTAYWVRNGLGRLDPVLQQSGLRGVRWGFVNMRAYIPILSRNGWRWVTSLSNGVQVWENPAAVQPVPIQHPPTKPIDSFAWGVFPLAALSISAALALQRYLPQTSARVLVWVQAFAVALLPLSLTLWYFRQLFAATHARIYFTYSDALFFLSDGLAVIAILAWLIPRIPARAFSLPKITRYDLVSSFKTIDGWLIALLAFMTLSVLWSADWRTALYVSLHSWLAYGLFLSLRSTPQAWHWFGIGCVAALFLQFSVASVQFVTQSTVNARLPGLEWPGSLIPAVRGASVVQLADGERWLRAYGTLPHPNILGGFALAMFAASLPWIFSSRGWPWLLPLLVSISTITITLSFSRSAWLGGLMLASTLLYHFRRLERRKLVMVLSTGVLVVAVLIIPLGNLFSTRLGGQQVAAEQVSTYTRNWLVLRSLEMISQRPILGVGVGGFSLALSRHVASFYQIEPVHNIPLLALSELGLVGLVIVLGLIVIVMHQSWRARSQIQILLSAALFGVACTGLFDHYLWTLAPGRLLLAALLGLWASQAKVNETRN